MRSSFMAGVPDETVDGSILRRLTRGPADSRSRAASADGKGGAMRMVCVGWNVLPVFLLAGLLVALLRRHSPEERTRTCC
jgi:hypothetical protein